MEQKRPKTGLLVLFVGLAGLGAGFALGRLTGEEPPVTRAEQAASAERFAEAYGAADPEFGNESEGPGEPDAPATAQKPEESTEPPVEPRELIDALRRNAGTERSQKMLIGMVADAARLGSKVLPEIRQMLADGDDIKFTSYKPGQPGYPSLRVALLDAAASTGDPAAIEMIAQVAKETESPVEVVFSAHVLDKLDALDAETAQRTLDTALVKLDKAQAKAVGSMLGKVIPAAAAADPVYAETLLQQQVRNPDRTNNELRRIAPMLNGLSLDRAQDLVMRSMTATDVTDKAKYQLASQAARRPEVEMMRELRAAIESNMLEPRVSRTIAANSVSGRPYSKTYKTARKALRNGDIRGAQAQAKVFEARLAEATKTIQAARAAGAKVPPKYNKQASIHRENLNALLVQIRRKHEQLKKQAAAAAK
ncbi:MAG: hypothetical protein ACYTGZ_07280 [Planctomycetota bacterium]|jgi:hypothetical protein